MALMGIDVGTTGCKVSTLSERGIRLSSAYREYPPTRCKNGYCEIDSDIVWGSVSECILECTQACPGERVEALSVSSFGEAAVPIDRHGRALYNGILMSDPRGRTQAESLAAKMGADRLARRTGLPLHPMYTVFRAMWLKENAPEVYREAERLLQFEDLILFHLTGETVTDHSLAARTMAFNVAKKEWDEEILEAAGLRRDIFSIARPSGSSVGYVRRSVAKALGLSDRALVVTGGHDQPCAALGSGVIHEGMAADGIGTAECITTCFNRPRLDGELWNKNYHCGPHTVSNMYITFAYTMSAGGLLKWFRETIGRAERQDAQNAGLDAYAYMDSQVADAPTGLLVLPHFSGSGTPYLDETSTGAVIGLTGQTAVQDIYRSILESVTYEMKLNLEKLENADIRINTLRASGGGARSDVWLQIKADILGRPVSTLETDEAGVLGAALLAGVAAGIYRDLEEAVRYTVREKRTFLPDPARIPMYEEPFRRYKKLYPAIKSIWN